MTPAARLTEAERLAQVEQQLEAFRVLVGALGTMVDALYEDGGRALLADADAKIRVREREAEQERAEVEARRASFRIIRGGAA